MLSVSRQHFQGAIIYQTSGTKKKNHNHKRLSTEKDLGEAKTGWRMREYVICKSKLWLKNMQNMLVLVRKVKMSDKDFY